MKRQGDILMVKRGDNRTGEGEAVPREHGAIVLAYGESSGHRHQIAAKGAKLFRRGSVRMLEIGGRGGAIVEVTDNVGKSLSVVRHHPVKLSPGSWEIVGQREYHDEDVFDAID